jgi:hypothetical protein
MTNPRAGAVVTNAADTKQVRHGRRVERDKRAKEVDDLRHVLSDPIGRRVFWRLITYCGVFETPYHPNNSAQSHSIGRGDVGRFVIGEIVDTDQELYFQMQREAHANDKRDALENEASRTPSSTETGDERESSDA